MTFRSMLLAAAAMAAFTASAPAPAAAQEFEPNHINPQLQGPRDRDRDEVRVLTVRQMLGRLRSELEGEPIAVSPLHRGGGTPYYIVEWRFPNGMSRSFRVSAVDGRRM